MALAHVHDPSTCDELTHRIEELTEEERATVLRLLERWQARLPDEPADELGMIRSNLAVEFAPTTAGNLRIGRRELAELADEDRGGALIALPPGDTEPSEGSLFDVIERRRSSRDFSTEAVSLDSLGALLHHACGVNAWVSAYGLREYPMRRVPSGGGLESVDVYALAANVDGLDAGIYRYRHRSHELEVVEHGDVRWQIDKCVPYARWARFTPVLLVLVARLHRLRWKYGLASYRLVHIDTGILTQNLYLTATELGLNVCAVLGFDEHAATEVMRLTPGRELLTLCLAVGQAPVEGI